MFLACCFRQCCLVLLNPGSKSARANAAALYWHSEHRSLLPETAGAIPTPSKMQQPLKTLQLTLKSLNPKPEEASANPHP